MTLHKFDKDYFENGQRTGISLYRDFRWLPQVSFPIANTVKNILKCESILDYGCAKGFIVYALRLLGVSAYGYDVSEYAISNCKPEVSDYLYLNMEDIPMVEGILVKDVLEHIRYEDICNVLKWICNNCRKAMIIVPLADNGEYRIAEYVFDSTHIIKENEGWWAESIIKAGFVIDEFYHHIDTIKDDWYKHNKYGNGIFVVKGIMEV